MNWKDFLPIAASVVSGVKEKYRADGFVMGGGGGGSSTYERKGQGFHHRFYTVPSSILDLVNSNVATTALPSGLGSLRNDALTRLLTMRAENQPGFSQLVKVAQKDPTVFAGRAALERVAGGIDPFSSEFARQTEDAYLNAAKRALAQATTGPQFVRGGEAATGIAQALLSEELGRNRAAELRRARQEDIQSLLAAAGGLGQLEGQRASIVKDASTGLTQIGAITADALVKATDQLSRERLQNLQVLQLAAMLQGKTTDHQIDDFRGRGSQDNWQAGVSCCFIFYANGKGEDLPWVIEIARQELWTKRRERGYKRMSRLLVPLMKRFRLVNELVGLVLVRPAIRYCQWLYGDKPFKTLAAAVSYFWLGLWSVVGGKIWPTVCIFRSRQS